MVSYSRTTKQIFVLICCAIILIISIFTSVFDTSLEYLPFPSMSKSGVLKRGKTITFHGNKNAMQAEEYQNNDLEISAFEGLLQGITNYKNNTESHPSVTQESSTKQNYNLEEKTLQDTQARDILISNHSYVKSNNSATEMVNSALLINELLGPGSMTATGMKNESREKDISERTNQTTNASKITDNSQNVPTASNKGVPVKALHRANVLFIIADDMRPEIGAYKGDDFPWLYPNIHTPNLDKLASQGILFRKAFCQQPLCNPSRSSLMTSRRPNTTGIINNDMNFRSTAPNLKTIGQFFAEQGYVTLGMGKIFHTGIRDDGRTWTEPSYQPSRYLEDARNGWRAYTKEELKGKKLMDQETFAHFQQKLDKFANGARNKSRPFFIGFGLKKPHVPSVFPVEFLSYYPANISLPPNLLLPKNIPDVAWRHKHQKEQSKPGFDPRYTSVVQFSETFLKQMNRAYYASITYVDGIIGDVLKELEKQQLENDTIILFMSDHGVHLGESGIYGKKTNFLINAHVPLIIRVPGVTDKGIVTNKLVELVDVFPTLTELTGFQQLELCPTINSKQVPLCTEGSSLVPLIKNPVESKWKDRIFYQYPNPMLVRQRKFCMGYTVLKEKYRYTEWVLSDYQGIVTWEPPCAKEFYDLTIDPRETVNRATENEYVDVIKELHMQLQQGWRAALPLVE